MRLVAASLLRAELWPLRPNDEDEKVMQGRCVSERGAGKQRAFERL